MADRETKTPPEDLFVAAVEAVIFAAAEPVKPAEIATVFGGVPAEEIEQAVEQLRQRYEERGEGLQVEQVAGGYRLATRSRLGPWVRRFFRERNRTRLTPAGLETLAIVAYRQPITAPEIQAIRGVDPSGAIKNLLEKRMLRILGRKKVLGNPFLYGTTKPFLMHFALNSLDDLPSIENFEELVGHLEQIQERVFPDETDTVDPAAIPASETARPAVADPAIE